MSDWAQIISDALDILKFDGAVQDLSLIHILLTAARCCGPEVVKLFVGQTAQLTPKQKERAFQEVRWGQRAENIPVLEQAGITVDKFGGEAFRAAVSDGQAELAKLLLEKGADINYHKPTERRYCISARLKAPTQIRKAHPSAFCLYTGSYGSADR